MTALLCDLSGVAKFYLVTGYTDYPQYPMDKNFLDSISTHVNRLFMFINQCAP